MSDGADRTSAGRLFQIRGSAAAKAGADPKIAVREGASPLFPPLFSTSLPLPFPSLPLPFLPFPLLNFLSRLLPLLEVGPLKYS